MQARRLAFDPRQVVLGVHADHSHLVTPPGRCARQDLRRATPVPACVGTGLRGSLPGGCPSAAYLRTSTAEYLRAGCPLRSTTARWHSVIGLIWRQTAVSDHAVTHALCALCDRGARAAGLRESAIAEPTHTATGP